MKKLAAIIAISASLFVFVPAGQSTVEAAYNPCNDIDASTKEVYKFKRGSEELSFGRVVVTAGKSRPHNYCARFQTGGRVLRYSYSASTDYWRDGRCGPQAGGSGSGWQVGGSETYTLAVADKRCENRSWVIDIDGKNYVASFTRRNK